MNPSMGLFKNNAFGWLVLVSGGCQRFERMTIEAPDNEPIEGKLACGSSGSRVLRTDDVQGPLVTMRLLHGTTTFSEAFWYSMRMTGESESDAGLNNPVIRAGLWMRTVSRERHWSRRKLHRRKGSLEAGNQPETISKCGRGPTVER